MINKNEKVFLKTVIDGNINNPFLFFIHGYPDDESIWNKQIDYFKDRFYCIRLVLPNCGGKIDRHSGFDFLEVVELIKLTLINLNPEGQPINLITHDWGAFYGYLFEKKYSYLINRMVALDVGGQAKIQSNFMGYIIIVFYQLNLALAFILSQFGFLGIVLGRILTKFTLKILFALGQYYSSKEYRFSGPSRQTAFNTFQNYPYFYFWKQIFQGKSFMSEDNFYPSCPVLFIYGCQGIKSLMSFHDNQWLESITQNPESQIIKFENSGHWLMRDESIRLNKLIDNFLR